MSGSTQEDLRSHNVNIVQQVYAAFAKGDIGAILSALSPDVEWGEPPNPFNPAAGTRHGHEGFLEWLNIGRQSEEIMVLEPRKFLADSDTVAVVGYTKCLAKLPAEFTKQILFTWLPSRMARLYDFRSSSMLMQRLKPFANDKIHATLSIRGDKQNDE